jgi:hypothetical protein
MMYASDICQSNERCFEMKENIKKYIGMFFVSVFWILRRVELVKIYETSF